MRVKLIFAPLLFAVVGILSLNAQAANVVKFGASVTSANGSLATTLTWDATGAASCQASGSPLWTGAKPATGSLALPAITASGTYNLTLACSFTDNTMLLAWTAPTQNTDGSAVTNLAGFHLSYGPSATSMPTLITIASPATLTTTLTGLPAGTTYSVVRAFNAAGAESLPSNQVSKVIGAATVSQSVTLTVNPVPSPPTNLNAQ